MKSAKRKMANKISLWVIMVIALIAAFAGCDDESLVRKELYSVKILSVTPDLIDGVEQRHTVSVEYNIQLARVPDGLQLIIAFNTEDPHDFKVYGSTSGNWDYGYDGYFLDKNPSGTYTFDVTLTPKEWSPHGEFQASAYLGYIDGYGPNQVVGGTLASDTKTFPVSDDYWTIVWEFNGGAKNVAGWPEVHYPVRVAKGAVLARPSSNPVKDGVVPGGWYTDSAFTQKYNFANSVIADLNLYAKWEELTLEHLYGTWIFTNSSGISHSEAPHTLTITADSIRVQDRRGDYVRYSNAVWAGQPTASIDDYVTTTAAYPRGYTFTGSRSNYGQYISVYFGFVALSATGQAVRLKQDAATNMTGIPGIPSVYTKRE